MATFAFKLPDIGEGIAESEIAQWRVALGETIKEDQPLVDMLTDKAAVEIPSPVAGKVVRLHANAGDKVPVGAVLVTIETAGEAAEDAPSGSAPAAAQAAAAAKPAPAAAAPHAAAMAGSKPAPQANDGFYDPQPAAAPSVRRRARELGVDLHRVRGSHPSGRVLHEDVERRASGGAPAA
ncbi:MAG: E3 binding domain-containing protein, partial [Gammaproteobacteria bacterium]|nr:E3 binding domain-containing protein [Gammaproteobacteria bacterium]